VVIDMHLFDLILKGFAIWLISSIILMELTFAHFGAVMRARELRDSGKLNNRIDRWNHTTKTDWWTRNVRRRFVGLGKVLLDKMDTDGIHIK
jgi:hypothetical protein